MERRWSALTKEDVQIIADRTPVEQYTDNWLAKGEYTPPFADLSSREIEIECDKLPPLNITFKSIHELVWLADGQLKTEYYESRKMPGDDEIYLIVFYCQGSIPPTSYTIVADFETGLATVCIASFGVKVNPREAFRNFYFGLMKGYKDPGRRHGLTSELIGKAILWTYHEKENVKVRHIYTAPLYYTYIMKKDNKIWVASNPADYIKINDHSYIFSFIEERQAGTQGFFLINSDLLHDVGSFFGLQATGLECCTFGAKGEWSTAYDI